jgi:diacylglycerol kinase
MKNSKFSFKARLLSFKFAFIGLKNLIIYEHNARIHTIAAVFVLAAAIYFKIDKYEWLMIVLAIALVFALEAVNSAIESLADFISPQKNELIKMAKDYAAAAVLISALAAFCIGLIIFIPRIIFLFTFFL